MMQGISSITIGLIEENFATNYLFVQLPLDNKTEIIKITIVACDILEMLVSQNARVWNCYIDRVKR